MANPEVSLHLERAILKTTFVTRRLIQLGSFSIFDDLEKTILETTHNFDWEAKGCSSIDSEVFDQIEELGLNLNLYFCHPNHLVANPRSLLFYRSAAVLSQKALMTIAGVSLVKRIEEGRECSLEQAQTLAMTINRNLCAMYRTLAVVDRQRVKMVASAQFGITIDGSWRNQIGNEGERAIRALLTGKLLEEEELASITNFKSDVLSPEAVDEEWIEANALEIRSVLCVNGAVLQFSSEPDVTCIGPNGSITAGVEVKAGLDPAGALERLGAMQKSFEHILSREPSAATILLASCITDEVQRRLNSSRSVTSVRDLTSVLNNTSHEGTKFSNEIRGYLGLIEKRF